jgi:hypothetical protein
MKRLSGLLGLTFVLGGVIATSSLREARIMWTAQGMRDIEQHTVSEVLRGLTKNAIPAAAAAQADALVQGLVDTAVKRRPIRQALTVTNGVIGALLAVSALRAMRLRKSARYWLLQAAGVTFAFTLVQVAIGAVLGGEEARVWGQYVPPILAAMPDPPPGVASLTDASVWRWVAVIPPLIVGMLKAGYVAYLLVVLRRPAVRSLFVQ